MGYRATDKKGEGGKNQPLPVPSPFLQDSLLTQFSLVLPNFNQNIGSHQLLHSNCANHCSYCPFDFGPHRSHNLQHSLFQWSDWPISSIFHQGEIGRNHFKVRWKHLSTCKEKKMFSSCKGTTTLNIRPACGFPMISWCSVQLNFTFQPGPRLAERKM